MERTVEYSANLGTLPKNCTVLYRSLQENCPVLGISLSAKVQEISLLWSKGKITNLELHGNQEDGVLLCSQPCFPYGSMVMSITGHNHAFHMESTVVSITGHPLANYHADLDL